jgi:hypothetical protein
MARRCGRTGAHGSETCSGCESARWDPCGAPGAVLVTSNKRDIVDATRELRSERGQVWPFDPQGIVGATPDWWWNPLTYVTDEVKAEILADVFAAGSRDPSARTDAYFEPAGQRLLANLLLAAALAQRALTQVYLWLSDPTEEEPVAVLEENGYPLLAAALQSVVNAPEKQRGGVYGQQGETRPFTPAPLLCGSGQLREFRASRSVSSLTMSRASGSERVDRMHPREAAKRPAWGPQADM